MTKEEIKALIAEKIAGQGNQVDSGGALADILNGIIDSIPQVLPPTTLDFTLPESTLGNVSAEEMAQGLGITVGELKGLMLGQYVAVRDSNAGQSFLVSRNGDNINMISGQDDGSAIVVYRAIKTGDIYNWIEV